jgi:outer membrane biosynthesis protein TonB
MRKSLIASIVLHCSILVMALVVLPSPDAFKIKPQDAVQVDISMISDQSKQQAQSANAEKIVPKAAPKPVEEKKVEPAKKVSEEVKTAVKEPTPPPEPPKEQPKKEEPKPEPPKEEPKPLDQAALDSLLKKVDEPKKEEPKKQVEAKPVEKPPEKKKPVKKTPKFDTDDIAALLNKTDDTEKSSPQKKSEVEGAPTKGKKDVQGTDDGLSATIIDALRSRLGECWSVPPGAREANITVRVHFELNPDASLSGMPDVVGGTGDPLFNVTATSVVSAVTGCQFADILPPDKYDLWKEVTVNFNPNMMSGT